MRNKVSSPLLAALQTRIDTGKAIIGEIVPQALKSYQHEGWDWGTPMAQCIILAWGRFGNRLPISTNTWLYHPPPSFQALLPAFFFRPLPPQTLVPGCWPLTEGGQGGSKAIWSTQSHKVEVCNHVLFFHQTGTDCWYFKGQMLLTLTPLIYIDLWTSPD